jgi:hypothetical protein
MTAWKLSHSLKGLRPLAVMHDWMIFYSKGAVFKVGHDLKNPKLLCQLPAAGLQGRIAKYVRLFDRVLRSSPSHAIVFDNALFLARRSEIWRCDLNNGHLSLDFQIPDNRRSLSFSLVSKADGTNELVFGEYFFNPKMHPVRIWGRKSGESKWLQRYEFGEGEIEHVHAVSYVNGQVYVLTGDFGQAAGIWICDTEFSALRPLLRGQQAFRAAWMHAIDDRVLMATDSQLEENYLFEFRMENEGDVTLLPLASLEGSSIYASRGTKEIFFSTTVECGEPTGNFIRDIFDRRNGPSILSSKAFLKAGDGFGLVSELYSAEKDSWPFRLAQFGTFIFPSGTMPLDTLYAFGVALKGVDGSCLVFYRSKKDET